MRQFFRIQASPFYTFPSTFYCYSVKSFLESRTLSMELQRSGMGNLLKTASMGCLAGGLVGCLRLGKGGIFLICIQLTIINLMKSSEVEEGEKDRKIRRLTQINRELIEALKQQNQELSKRIAKQKSKGARSASLKSSPSTDSKQIESIRKELSNAYKQIDMYRQIVQGLKAKEAPLDHADKIRELQNKLKSEDAIIEGYQKELKYLATLREKQEKELKLLDSEEARQAKAALGKQITDFKERVKTLKKNANKRAEVEKRQHAYFVELEKALRKANDEYYPGKAEKKEPLQDSTDITEQEWTTLKSNLDLLRKTYQENNRKLDMMNRQKMRELKSSQENELKLKEKIRKLNTLRSRIAQLTKLTQLKEQPHPKPDPLPKKEEPPARNDKNRGDEREVKKWNVPEGVSQEKGKVQPDCSFISDKAVLLTHHKYRTVQVQVWCDGNGIPCLLRFIYEDESGQRVEGKEMTESVPSNLEPSIWQLKDKDYLYSISGKFIHGMLASLTLRSKLGKEGIWEDSNSSEAGQAFNFSGKPGDIPSCFYAATVKPRQDQIRICYLGCQFVSDW